MGFIQREYSREGFSFEIYDEDSRVTYTPFSEVEERDGWAIGFKAEHPDGRIEFILLNPSGGSDDGTPSVTVYQGIHGDVSRDEAVHHYDLFTNWLKIEEH